MSTTKQSRTQAPRSADYARKRLAELSKGLPFVGVEVAAQYLGIKRSAAYAAVAAGQIPAYRLGRYLKVPVVALERMACGDGPDRDRQ